LTAATKIAPALATRTSTSPGLPDLITGLRDQGLDVTRPILAVLDGAKALSRAVRDVFDKLPDRLRAVTERRMRQAYHAESALKAEGELDQLARELDKTHPPAAGQHTGGLIPAGTDRSQRAGTASARPGMPRHRLDGPRPV